MMIAVMLIRCSLSLWAPMICDENLTRPEPQSKFGGSRAAIDTRLPWYTSGFV